MAKKKNQNNGDFQDFPQDSELPVEEEPIDEEEEGEEKESDDVYAEDEGDKEMMRKLEEEDRRIALDCIAFDEEVGFNPMFDWATVPEAERNRFAEYLRAEAATLEAVSWKRFNPFQRWMLARACSRRGMHDMFREITASILRSKKRPELCLEDIHLELIGDYLDTGNVKEANDALDAFAKAFPDEEAAALRVRGLIHVFNGEHDDGKKCFDELVRIPFNRNIEGHSDDAAPRDSDKRNGVIQYEIGYALLNMKKYEQALHYFERAHNLANMNDDDELTMSIENARSTTMKCMNGDD